MSASIYQAIGHEKWVELHEALGDALPPELREAKPAEVVKHLSHKYGECAHGPSRCKHHRTVYRAMLAKKRAELAAESRDKALQVRLATQRISRVAAASRRTEPAPQVEAPRTQVLPSSTYCHFGDHDKCFREGRSQVRTRRGWRECSCDCHTVPDVPINQAAGDKGLRVPHHKGKASMRLAPRVQVPAVEISHAELTSRIHAASLRVR